MRVVLEKLNVKNLTEQPELAQETGCGRAGAVKAPLITFAFLRLVAAGRYRRPRRAA